MAVRIKFDREHNVIQPTFVLATRSGKKIGVIRAENIEVSDSMNTYFELSFQVQKEVDGVQCILWNDIEDFKLVWCREWDVWFEIHAEISESNNTVKNINAISLGEAELSQTMLYSIEINTENDIAREDYDANYPTVLYRETHLEASLLHRIMEKVPHYKIKHVDASIRNIQRTFTFDGTSLYDAFQKIAEEISCIFIINSGTNEDGKIAREISVYDLESYCLDCSHRDSYFKTCPKCGGNNVLTGYGEDTTIFISTENLADEITYTTDKDSVKNCFKLEAGDDLMTATIANCNPNGSGYIWYVSDLSKRDMSNELVQKLDEYNEDYAYYQNEYVVAFGILSHQQERTFVVGQDVQVGDIVHFRCLKENVSKAEISYSSKTGFGIIGFGNEINDKGYVTAELDITEDITNFTVNEYVIVYIDSGKILTAYNDLVTKYFQYNNKLEKIPDQVIGYPELMTAYYNTIDLNLYLNSELMPTIEIQDTTASEEMTKLKESLAGTTVAVQNLQSCSASTATSAVLSFAKTIIDSRYQVKAKDGILEHTIKTDENTGIETVVGATWTGTFVVTNYSDEEDTATENNITAAIDGDREGYIKQKLNKALDSSESDESVGIVTLFNLEIEDFKLEIQKYCLKSLESFRDACQTCLDILIEQGIADSEAWVDKDPNLYDELYMPYYNKNDALIQEIKLRETEIALIVGSYDSDGKIIESGMQTLIENEQLRIQQVLNFENYLGEKLWTDFIAYRREDTYQNSNYVSDGLSNKEIFERSLEFIEVAKKEIYKSSTLQHSIKATLKNLLVMKEFEVIVDYFSVGNWIRVRINDKVYRLRLLSYTIDFENLDNITIEFSDVLQYADSTNDVESILNQAQSMAGGYDSVKKQASQGKKGKEYLDNWVTKGLDLTKMKIINNADHQGITIDSHGLLCREYLPLTDTYDDKQLKIINKGLYLTDDNWLTSRAGIGNFVYYNPLNGQEEEAYGVIADTLVGNLILSEKVGIYNSRNSITLDENGLVITTDYDEANSTTNNMTFTIQKKSKDVDGNEIIEQLMYIDDEGNVVLNGSIRINTASDSTISSINDLADTNRFSEEISNKIHNELHGENGVYSTINEKYESAQSYADSILTDYKTEVGQYLDFSGDNGLVIGAATSDFKTVIDNNGMYFRQGDTIVSYVNNKQLHIPNAVIENSLILGKFFFAPREDGGVSLTWQGD